jgi:G3E family GTPase
MPTRVPFTILTGWLGAGKTTALNRMREAARGEVIVISDAFWRSHFGADPNVLSQLDKHLSELLATKSLAVRGRRDRL